MPTHVLSRGDQLPNTAGRQAPGPYGRGLKDPKASPEGPGCTCVFPR